MATNVVTVYVHPSLYDTPSQARAVAIDKIYEEYPDASHVTVSGGAPEHLEAVKKFSVDMHRRASAKLSTRVG